ncbi:MAG TPA: hypothetical protein VF541_02630, partial [Longimicrobium sp.]
ASIAFGHVGKSVISEMPTVVVRNTGDAPVPVSAVTLEGPAVRDFRVTSDRCSGRTLAPGAECRLRIRFIPQLVGERDAVLRVRGPGGGGPAVRLSGVGGPTPG